MLFLLAGGFNSFADALDNWRLATTTTNNISGIAYGNGIFVSVNWRLYQFGGLGNYGGISACVDGKAWTQISVREQVFGLAYGNGIFVAGASDPSTSGDGGNIYSSTNGLDWVTPTNTGVSGINGVAYGNGVFVAVGFFYEFQQGVAYSSTNGTDWYAHYPVTTNLLNGVAYGNGRFVAIGAPNFPPRTNVVVTRSTDGTNWTSVAIPNPFTGPVYGPVFVKSNFYAFQGSNWYVSSSGAVWTPTNGPIPAIWIPTVSSNGLYLSRITNGALYISTDATNWSPRSTGLTNDLGQFAYGSNTIMAAGGGAIFQSGSTVPSLSGAKVPSGFQVNLTDGIETSYRLEGSTNLVNWTNLATITNVGASPQFLDTNAASFPRQYYRAIRP